MSYQKLATLLTVLSEKTESGRIEWEESARSNSYETSFPNYSVVLSHRPSSVSEDDYVLYVVDARGDVVEEAADYDFREFMENPYSRMKELYETARRQAKGVDQALDEILKDLNSDFDDEIPF